jgi:D-sedoheptulose 7-phosphate isomerase
MDYRPILEDNLRASTQAKHALLASGEPLDTFTRAADEVVHRYRSGGRLYIAGNGSSAADAQHLAAEFVSKLATDRASLPAEALTTGSSIITAIGNDYGCEAVFARQLAGKAGERAVFLGITTSGASPNILKALELCRARRIPSIVLCGRDGGAAKPLAISASLRPARRRAPYRSCASCSPTACASASSAQSSPRPIYPGMEPS